MLRNSTLALGLAGPCEQDNKTSCSIKGWVGFSRRVLLYEISYVFVFKHQSIFLYASKYPPLTFVFAFLPHVPHQRIVGSCFNIKVRRNCVYVHASPTGFEPTDGFSWNLYKSHTVRYYPTSKFFNYLPSKILLRLPQLCCFIFYKNLLIKICTVFTKYFFTQHFI